VSVDWIPGGLSPEDEARYQGVVEAYMQVDLSPLVGVVPIGLTAERSAVRVELIALEVRRGGGILYWKAYPAEERMLGGCPDLRWR
jgi:hypothetical protein